MLRTLIGIAVLAAVGLLILRARSYSGPLWVAALVVCGVCVIILAVILLGGRSRRGPQA